MRRSFILVPLFLILVAAGFWWWWRPRPILTIVTWPGAYGRAQAAAQILPYGQARRVDARIAQWDGRLDDLRQWIKSGHYGGDVVDMELPAAVAACREGLLEPIDPASLPPGDDGAVAAKDFLPGMVGRCFVASAIYGQTVVCRKPCPGGLSDLFDRARPTAERTGLDAVSVMAARNQKIGLQRTAKVNLEMALLADGVKPDQVYRLLETDAGVARAFAKLDTIKANIVWWRSAGEPAELLRRKQVTAATILTAEAQIALQAPGLSAQDATLSRIWPQFHEADVLGVPAGDPKKARAMDYIRYATASGPLANMVKFAPYTPPRRSSLPLVETLPASPSRDFVLAQKGASFFAVNDAFWDLHGPALEARFRAWAAS